MQKQLIIFFDGQCAICTFFQRVMQQCDVRKRLMFVDLHHEAQRVALAPTLALSDLLVALHCILPDGRIVRGVDAIATILCATFITIPLGLFVKFVLCIPYGRAILTQSYAWIAQRRCSSGSCGVPR